MLLVARYRRGARSRLCLSTAHVLLLLVLLKRRVKRVAVVVGAGPVVVVASGIPQQVWQAGEGGRRGGTADADRDAAGRGDTLVVVSVVVDVRHGVKRVEKLEGLWRRWLWKNGSVGGNEMLRVFCWY